MVECVGASKKCNAETVCNFDGIIKAQGFKSLRFFLSEANNIFLIVQAVSTIFLGVVFIAYVVSKKQ